MQPLYQTPMTLPPELDPGNQYAGPPGRAGLSDLMLRINDARARYGLQQQYGLTSPGSPKSPVQAILEEQMAKIEDRVAEVGKELAEDPGPKLSEEQIMAAIGQFQEQARMTATQKVLAGFAAGQMQSPYAGNRVIGASVAGVLGAGQQEIENQMSIQKHLVEMTRNLIDLKRQKILDKLKPLEIEGEIAGRKLERERVDENRDMAERQMQRQEENDQFAREKYYTEELPAKQIHQQLEVERSEMARWRAQMEQERLALAQQNDELRRALWESQQKKTAAQTKRIEETPIPGSGKPKGADGGFNQFRRGYGK